MSNIETFKRQVTEYLSEAKKKVDEEPSKENTMAYAGVNMVVIAIENYLEKEILCDDLLDKAIGLPWKNASRLFKFIFDKAKPFATAIGGVDNCAMIPDQTVYGWVHDYYFLDDKEEVEKEEKEQAEKAEKARILAERTKAEEEEKARKKREKAIEKLSTSEDWESLSDEEKEERIKAEMPKIIVRSSSSKKKGTSSKKKGKKSEEEIKPEIIDPDEHLVENAEFSELSDDEDGQLSFVGEEDDEEC